MSDKARRALKARGSKLVSRALLAFVLTAPAALRPRDAAAETEYRPPGLEGQWTNRHLTAPMNSLRVIAGPGQPMLMGERYADQVIDGGGQYVHAVVPNPGQPEENQWWFRGGVSFGLTEDWEAGALFVPLQFTPKFRFSNVTAFVTRGFRLGAIDFGVRLSFQTPALKAYDVKGWSFNPGIPFLYRAGPLRLDAAVLAPIATSDGSVGLNVPLRASVSLTPRFFFGIESGFVEPRLDTAHDTTVPLGALAGYTELFGSRVVDFTASFDWDDFWLPSPPKGRQALELEHYRVGFGLVFHTLVR
jgi:hypothetical protein